jgi:pimeloyl-ACP methyl ester carboxylesterase
VTGGEAAQLTWEIDGLTLKGLAWGEPGGRPVLALHGWLDNAASFALLAPLLKGHYVVAPDLTGHGQSDWRSPDATYQVYDDIPQIVGIVDLLGWDDFNLLGHSRGAIISSILASAFPERVRRLVLLDGVSPPPLAENEFVGQLRNYVIERKRLLARRPRIYPDVQAAVAAREEQGLTPEAASLIARRNLRPCEEGYLLTTDPRLRGASAVKLTPGQVKAMLDALETPTLLMMAEQGLAVTHAKRFSAMDEHVPRARVEAFPGGHHFHMESEVATLATRILTFFEDEK